MPLSTLEYERNTNQSGLMTEPQYNIRQAAESHSVSLPSLAFLQQVTDLSDEGTSHVSRGDKLCHSCAKLAPLIQQVAVAVAELYVPQSGGRQPQTVSVNADSV